MDFSFENKIVLEDDRVRLEPLTLKHKDQLLEFALQHPNLLEFSPSQIDSESSMVNYIETALQTKDRLAFVIYDKKHQAYAGSTSYGYISNEHKKLQIGWTWINPKFQRSGLNRHCKFLMLQYAFEKLQFNRVEFITDSRNEKSRLAIQKIGGTFEGCLRSHIIMSDGFLRDSVYYSILKEEWPQIKSTIFSKMQ